jgi:hypothetical protein
MGGFDGEKARHAFNVPERYQILAMLSLGFATVVETLPDDLKQRELAPRNRKPLGELFFNGVWNQPVI